MFFINSNIKLIDPSNNKIINDKGTIKKSSWKNKADIIIDFIDVSKKYYVSIKCNDGAAPTLLNHTSLCAKCWETERLKNFFECINIKIDKKIFFESLVDKIKNFKLDEDHRKKSKEDIIRLIKNTHREIAQEHIIKYLNSK